MNSNSPAAFRPRVSPRLLWPALAVAAVALCWRAGYELGGRGARTGAAASGAGAGPATDVVKRGAGSASPSTGTPGESVTPASTAALLESTLVRLRAMRPGPGFTARLDEARLVAELGSLDTPRLLALVDALLDEGSSAAEEMAGRLLGPVLQPRDPAAVWAWLRDGAATGNETRVRFLSGVAGIFQAWAERDPAAALAAWDREARPFAEAGKTGFEGLTAVFRAWSAAHPDAALEAARAMTDPALRARAAEGLAGGLRKMLESVPPSAWPADAAALVERVLAFSADQAAPALYGLARGRLREETPPEVAAWAEGLDMSREQRAMFRKSLADTWMTTDAPAAADWYLKGFPEGAPGDADSAARGQALERIMRKWTRVDERPGPDPFPEAGPAAIPPDPAAASDWLNAQGLGPETAAAMTALARAWGQAREPEAALAWARALPEETARARALEAVTEEIRQRFPNDWRRLTGQ